MCIRDSLHTEILKNEQLRDFYEMMPEKFNNKTNGITQRRFLAHGNPLLSDWITKHIGDEWKTELSQIEKLKPLAEDEQARKEFMQIKYQNKVRLAKYIKEHNGIDVDPRSIFDVQVKRLHEYKRQLLNILHVMYPVSYTHLDVYKRQALETPSETDQLENWPAGPAVYAHSAIVMDMNSGAILYSKKAEERHFPASITKLLTTLVALENAELTDKVTFSQASVDILNWDDAHIGMRPGEEISMKDALRAVLLASANEVSYAVAESTGITHLNGGYDTFIELMNTRAKELGCTNSHWVNPNGLHDEEHYTTAHDMALIASAVYQQKEFRNIMNILEYRIPPTNLVDEERVFQQNHKMLWPENRCV